MESKEMTYFLLIHKELDTLRMRMRELENRFDLIHKQDEKINSNKPHKCPICDGKGFIYHAIIHKVNCMACEGKGIVWG